VHKTSQNVNSSSQTSKNVTVKNITIWQNKSKWKALYTLPQLENVPHMMPDGVECTRQHRLLILILHLCSASQWQYQCFQFQQPTKSSQLDCLSHSVIQCVIIIRSNVYKIHHWPISVWKQLQKSICTACAIKPGQDSWAIAKKTARCAQYTGALKSFESPHYAPDYFSRNL